MGKRGTFSFRVTLALREKLQAQANAESRSVSHVIEARLNQSFRDEDVRDVVLSAMGLIRGTSQIPDKLLGDDWLAIRELEVKMQGMIQAAVARLREGAS